MTILCEEKENIRKIPEKSLCLFVAAYVWFILFFKLLDS